LKKWHNGVKIAFESVKGGILEDKKWKGIKQEFGVERLVIDKIVGASAMRAVSIGSRPSGSSAASMAKVR
jgi:hypothetical protein